MENDIIIAEVLSSNIMSICDTTVSDSVLYKKIKFKFPKDWSGYTVTAVFSGNEKTISIILNGDSKLCTGKNECYIPYEVIKEPQFTVSTFGVLGNSIITSTAAAVKVIKSGYAEGEAPSEPTPTEYEQLLYIADETKKIAQSVRDDADNGVFKGEKGGKGDKGDTGARGEKGEKGDTGTQGNKGDKGDTGATGAAAGFGTPTISVTQLSAGAEPTAAVTASGDNTKKVFGFNFGIPKGEKGDTGEVSLEQLNTTASSEAQRANNAFANALKGNASGSAVLMPDTSPVEHNIDVRLRRKNLIDPTLWSAASTSSGITVQYLADEDCFVLNGTTSNAKENSWGVSSVFNTPLNAGANYTLSATYVSGTVAPENKAVFYIGSRDTISTATGGNWLATKLNMSGTNVTAGAKKYLTNFWFYCYGEVTFTDYKVKLQLEENSTPTAYTPYVSDFTTSKVTRYGKNLFDMNLIDVMGYYDLGGNMVDYAGAGLDHYTEVLENGYIVQGGHKSASNRGDSVHSNGWFSPGGNNAYYKKIGCYVPAGVTITWSYDVTLLERVYFPNDDYPFVFRTNNWALRNMTAPTKENIRLTLNEKKHITVTGVNPHSGILCPQFTLNACKLKIENIQLEINDTETEYTPFCDSDNLFDTSSVTGCYVRTTGEAYPTGGSIEDNVLISNCGASAKDLVWGASTMHLKKGIYDIIADCYYTAEEGATATISASMGVGNATKKFTAATDYTNNYIKSLNYWRRLCCRIEVSEDGDYNIILQPSGKKTDIDFRFKNIQIRHCGTLEYTPNADGTVGGVKSLYPETTLSTNPEGLIIDAEYNRDINKAFAELQQAILSTGGNV